MRLPARTVIRMTVLSAISDDLPIFLVDALVRAESQCAGFIVHYLAPSGPSRTIVVESKAADKSFSTSESGLIDVQVGRVTDDLPLFITERQAIFSELFLHSLGIFAQVCCQH